MTLDRWHRLEHLYHAALERPDTERSTYLREACSDDPELLQEIEELLRSPQGTERFLETPALATAASDLVSQSMNAGDSSRTIIAGGPAQCSV
jgi:hypothetical protein